MTIIIPKDTNTDASPSRTAATPADAGQGGSLGGAGGAGVESVSKDLRAGKRRVSMSAPQRRLEAAQIPGFHLHWMREENVPRALQAFYEFVFNHETEINTRNVGVESGAEGGNDLADRVTVQHGGETMYLMKLPEEYYQEDMASLGERNNDMMKQIFRGEEVSGALGANPGDTSHKYVKEAKIEGPDMARAAITRARQPLFARRFK